MRFLKFVGLLLCVMALGSIAMAGDKTMGIREVNSVTFAAPVRVGTVMLPAGDYVVRHTMEGQEHVMVFQQAGGKDLVKVKCTLVPLEKKADQTQAIYELTASNERVLQELVFKGDSAKHVF
jgi:hypothetical protein